MSPIIRFSQPIRADEPASASSTASIAAKWLRLGAGMPTAWTAPKRPSFHIESTGSNSGCSPNMESLASRDLVGTARVGRALA